MGPWSSVGLRQDQPSEKNAGKQHVRGFFQIIGLSTPIPFG